MRANPGLLFAAIILALPVASAHAPGDELKELDRVQVYGSRQPIWALRRAVVEAEDRFFARYNELNRNHDFDVNCRFDARTGTRLVSRTCRPLYQEEAVRVNAKEAVEIRQRHDAPLGGGLISSPPVPAALLIMARRPEFERNMREVVERNPELVAMLKARAAAAEALEAGMHPDAQGDQPSALRDSRAPPLE